MSDEEFNRKEFERLLEQDRENQHVMLTRAQHRELLELLEDRRMRRRAVAMVSALAKWVIVVGAGVAALQVGWGNLAKWFK